MILTDLREKVAIEDERTRGREDERTRGREDERK
jgi:hypothetical protein